MTVRRGMFDITTGSYAAGAPHWQQGTARLGAHSENATVVPALAVTTLTDSSNLAPSSSFSAESTGQLESPMGVSLGDMSCCNCNGTGIWSTRPSLLCQHRMKQRQRYTCYWLPAMHQRVTYTTRFLTAHCSFDPSINRQLVACVLPSEAEQPRKWCSSVLCQS